MVWWNLSNLWFGTALDPPQKDSSTPACCLYHYSLSLSLLKSCIRLFFLSSYFSLPHPKNLQVLQKGRISLNSSPFSSACPNQTEGWIAEVLDPVRRVYFPTLQLFLPTGTYKGQSYASLCGFLDDPYVLPFFCVMSWDGGGVCASVLSGPIKNRSSLSIHLHLHPAALPPYRHLQGTVLRLALRLPRWPVRVFIVFLGCTNQLFVKPWKRHPINANIHTHTCALNVFIVFFCFRFLLWLVGNPFESWKSWITFPLFDQSWEGRKRLRVLPSNWSYVLKLTSSLCVWECRSKGVEVKEEKKEEYAAMMGTLYEVSVLRSPKVRLSRHV
jgi:hypothetical protein